MSSGQNITAYIQQHHTSWHRGVPGKSKYYPAILAYLKEHPGGSREVADTLGLDQHKAQAALYRMRRFKMIRRVYVVNP